MPLRRTLLLLGLLACAVTASTQSPPPPPPGVPMQMPEKSDPSARIPQFDVISVKPAKDSMTRMQFTPDGLRGSGVTVRFLLYEGFGGINHDQVIGEPDWSNTAGFDIDAKVAPADLEALGKLTFEQRRTMFQQILADRFKLVVHHETRELLMYSLVVAKGGPKLKPTPPADPAAGPPRRGMMMSRNKVTANDAQLSMLVTMLARTLGHTVVDKTGLTGNYDFTLEFAPEEGAGSPLAAGSAAGASAPDQSSPDIFTAVQEQLGLKLEPTKGPVEVLVVDHVERPSED